MVSGKHPITTMSVTAQFDLEEEGAALKIQDPLDINSVEELHEALTQYASRESNLELDLSRVQHCDAAGLQLLCALRKSAVTLGKTLRISAVSKPFTTLALELGLPVESLTLTSDQPPVDGKSDEEGLPVADASNQGECDGM